MLQLGIKVIQNKAMYWLVLKKEKYSDLKKKKQRKHSFDSKMEWLFTVETVWAGNTDRPRNAGSKDKRFYKSWIKKIYAIIDHLM